MVEGVMAARPVVDFASRVIVAAVPIEGRRYGTVIVYRILDCAYIVAIVCDLTIAAQYLDRGTAVVAAIRTYAAGILWLA
jgi:hypothetical protein